MKAAVDDSGYDLGLDCAGQLRYIQLKSRMASGKATKVTINVDLIAKPGSAVVWMLVDDELHFTKFLLFEPNMEKEMDGLKVAKHAKGNSWGSRPSGLGTERFQSVISNPSPTSKRSLRGSSRSHSIRRSGTISRSCCYRRRAE
ncbi:MAG: hypothetical protein ABIQ47_04210 [Tepidiformaceae bacterium]